MSSYKKSVKCLLKLGCNIICFMLIFLRPYPHRSFFLIGGKTIGSLRKPVIFFFYEAQIMVDIFLKIQIM